jgi:ribosomal protein L7/L12
MSEAELAQRILALERRVAALEVRAGLEPAGLEVSDDEIVALIQASRKIEAIKLYHERTGTDLGGAKAAVDRIEAQYLSGD